jgi:heme O synthase-like polyprenyltransferase
MSLLLVTGACGMVVGARGFLAGALALTRDKSRRRAGLLFHYSLLYLALLFLAMALDAVAG